MVNEVQPWFACRPVSKCEEKYNQISQSGIINGDRVHEIKVTA